MKRTKKIVLIMLAVSLMAVCFVFGVSAETWGDYEYAVLEDGTVEITKYNGSETELVIPEMIDGKIVTVIGEDAFWYKTEIKEIIMPNYIKKIGRSAFGACDSLECIGLSEQLEIIGESAFYRCGSLKKIEIPDSVNSIGGSVFSNCYSLCHVKLPNQIETIPSNMFVECKIENIDIPDSVLEIGEGAFSSCNNLTNFTIPDNIEIIGDYAFTTCLNLKRIYLSKNVKQIGIAAFSMCFSLEDIIVDINNENYASDRGVLFTKDYKKLLCYPCGKRDPYIIPDIVKEVGEYSFYCGTINQIVISEGVEKISEGAFAWCGNLKEVIIPSTVNYIGSYAFADCQCNLEKVVLKNKECVLGEYPFLDEVKLNGINYDEYVEKTLKANDALCNGDKELYEEINSELNNCIESFDEFYFSATFSCHSGSTAETYAIENGVKYELTHFFEGEWTYDYDNMVRTRKCIHCDELETEPLETTENGDVEIIEPVDPDTDFEVDEIKGDNFIVVEETVVNGIEGNAEVLRAFDITLKNKDGVHVQPDGTVKVKLPLDWTKDGIYKVYRVNDDGTHTDMNAYRQGSHMVFETDHFSIYVIVDVSEKSEADEPETPDVPTEPDTSDCNCICHAKDIIKRFIAIIYKFVIELLGIEHICECGVAHY